MNDDWFEKYMEIFFKGIMILLPIGLIALVVWIVWMANQPDTAFDACMKSGGSYTVDHYETSGSVVNGVGGVTTNPVYRCDPKVAK